MMVNEAIVYLIKRQKDYRSVLIFQQ